MCETAVFICFCALSQTLEKGWMVVRLSRCLQENESKARWRICEVPWQLQLDCKQRLPSVCLQMLHASLCSTRLVASRIIPNINEEASLKWMMFHNASSLFVYLCFNMFGGCWVVKSRSCLLSLHNGLKATAPLVELKTTVKNAFEPFVSDTIMEQISDQLAANGIFGRFVVQIYVHLAICWKLEWDRKNGRKSVFSIWKRARFVSRAICLPENRGQLPASSWLAAWKEPSHDHCRIH